MTTTPDNSSSKLRVHAMNMVLEVLCGQRQATRTSVVRRPYDRDRLARLVTCKKCRRIMRHG